MFKQELIAEKVISKFGDDGRKDLLDSRNAIEELSSFVNASTSGAVIGSYSATLQKYQSSAEEIEKKCPQEKCFVNYNKNDALKNIDLLDVSTARVRESDLKDLIWMSYSPEKDFEYIARLKDEASKGALRSPLHGLPVGVKDIFDVEGFQSTWGSKSRSTTPCSRSDGDLAKELKRSGCVIVGKQHTAELAMSPTGFNDYYGQGINPLHADRISGGSSSGAAMSVAAGHVPLAFGSDTGGSVRLPAALCGLVGLKPTNSRFTMNGGMPLSASLDCPGPIAKTVEMCGLGYMAMTGNWKGESNKFYMPWRDFDPELSSAAFPKFLGIQNVSREVEDLAKNLRSYLNTRGVRTSTVDEPDLTIESSLANMILSVEALLAHYSCLSRTPELIGRQVRRRLLKGLYVDTESYAKALLYRSYYLENFIQRSFGESRVLVLPVTPGSAPLVTETLTGEPKEDEKKFAELSVWTRAINYLGVPSITLPLGFDQEGLPIGLQIVGRPYDELHLIAFAYDVEKGIKNGF